MGKIGHASLGEEGKVSGGKAGDQTGSEVYIRSWYNKGWNVLLRPKSTTLAEKSAKFVEQVCENSNVGYDQGGRNTLYTQAKLVNFDGSKIKTPCECDCSSFMHCAAIAGGANLTYGSNGYTTRTMVNAFVNSGNYEKLTDSKYLTSDAYLKRGDILVKEGSHTAIALEDGSAVSTATTTTGRKGIDVSSNQGNINWSMVKSSGVEFVVLRSTLKNGKPDSKFVEYLEACKKYQFDISVYKYSYALTESQAIAEANTVISLLNGYKCKIWLDLEDNSQIALGKSGIAKIANAFIRTCEAKGYSVGIYCNLNWMKNYIDDSLKTKDMWIARYGKNDGQANEATYKPNVGEAIWQYTSNGQVNGISGKVDLNIMYKTVESSKPTTPTAPTTDVEYTELRKITASALNIRKTPDSSVTTNKTGKVYSKGQIVQVIAKSSNGWYKTNLGYISGSAQYSSSAVGKIFNCTALNFRTMPKATADSKVVDTLKAAQQVKLLKKENGWYYCLLPNGKRGWCNSKYIQVM